MNSESFHLPLDVVEPLETDVLHVQYMKHPPYIPHANKPTRNINSTWFPFERTADGNLELTLDDNI
ncbi:hypothetical protein RB213_003693 [Colletotrichum asianum]